MNLTHQVLLLHHHHLKQHHQETSKFFSIESPQDITINENENFSFFLKGSISTGYSWGITNLNEVINSNTVKYFNDNQWGRYVQDPSPVVVIGAGGNYYFDFKSLKQGTLKISLSYARPWETNNTNNQKANVIIHVIPNSSSSSSSTSTSTSSSSSSSSSKTETISTIKSEINQLIDKGVEIFDSHMNEISSGILKYKFILMMILGMIMI
jgi:predicted secreted protein